MELSSKGSSGTCIPEGVPTFLPTAFAAHPNKLPLQVGVIEFNNALDGHLASDSGRSERLWLLCEVMLSYALGNSMASPKKLSQ